MEADFYINSVFSRAETDVSSVVAEKAKIPPEITGVYRDFSPCGGCWGMRLPSESLKNEAACSGFLSSPTKAALAPRQGSVA